MSQIGDLAKKAEVINGLSLVASHLADGVSGDDLRKIAQELLHRVKSSVIVLVSIVEGKAILVVAVSEDARKSNIKAGALVKVGSAVLGGGGGGKDDFAQGGGTNLSAISDALSAITRAISGK
jgi:alanyl-tRNA synthetase